MKKIIWITLWMLLAPSLLLNTLATARAEPTSYHPGDESPLAGKSSISIGLASGCLNIAGQWSCEGTSIGYPVDTMIGPHRITQNDCNVSWELDPYQSLSGIVSGNVIQASGTYFYCIDSELCYLTQNTFTVSGTVYEDNTMKLNSSASATGYIRSDPSAPWEPLSLWITGEYTCRFSPVYFPVYFLDKDNPSRQVSGAAADGASEVLIQISNIPQDTPLNKIIVSIPDSTDGEVTCQQQIVNGTYTCTYKAPFLFVRENRSEDITHGERKVNLVITVNDQNISHSDLLLIKPPVVLLHGLWDYASTWNELKSKLMTEHGYQYIYPHQYSNSAHLSQLSQEMNIAAYLALRLARSDNFVAKKADVVAHSMGGLIAKLYGNESNIHSITTVGTPHFGSPLADILWPLVDNADKNLFERFIADLFLLSGHPVTYGAIEDLRVNGGKHCGVRDGICMTNVPNYVILGISPLTTQTGILFINLLAKVFNLYGLLPLAADLIEINQFIFGGQRNDWIVSESSQKGGLTGAVDDYVLWHLSETTDEEVLQKIINFLHRTSSTPLMIQSAGTKSQVIPKLLNAVPNLEMGISSGEVQITNPLEGQVFQIGDTVNVQVNVSNENALVLIATSTGESALIDHSPYNFQFVIPNEVVGPLTIMVGARDDVGFMGSDQVTINVASTATLIDMKVYPDISPLHLPVGASIPLTVYGLYDDNVSRNITSSGTGTSYISSNPAILEVSTEGIVTAKSQGEAIVTISNSGLKKEIAVVVSVITSNVFSDVPSDYWAYDYIIAIYNNGITTGCAQDDPNTPENERRYCPEESVTRGQMAAFIIRAKYGENFSYTTTPYFTDVPSTHTFFKYVQKLKDDGITAVSGTYEVETYVTRGQMAAFIIRAKFGETFSYTTTPYFSDVPSTHTFFKYVQKLKDEGITALTGIYGVDDNVTRAQMAAFLARAFLGME
jgi:hypothetical protein